MWRSPARFALWFALPWWSSGQPIDSSPAAVAVAALRGVPAASAAAKSLRSARSAIQTRNIRLVHVAKTGGASLREELTLLSFDVDSQETCWPSFVASRASASNNSLFVVVLRAPRSHVRSMFIHCRNHKGARMGRGAERPGSLAALPNNATGYELWLDHFLTPGWRSDSFEQANADRASKYTRQADQAPGARRELIDGCLNPWNMQARTMVCRYDAETGSSHFVGTTGAIEQLERPDLELAMTYLEATDVVAVTELYHESICVLVHRASGTLPSFCDCDRSTYDDDDDDSDPQRERANVTGAYEHVHEQHHSERYDTIPNEPDSSTASKIDQLTSVDAALYVGALKRLLADIGATERATNAKILCAATITTLASQLAYVPGARGALKAVKFRTPRRHNSGTS